MKNVMTIAWEVARGGQRRFGGKVSAYLKEALKIAWAYKKAEKNIKATMIADEDHNVMNLILTKDGKAFKSFMAMKSKSDVAYNWKVAYNNYGVRQCEQMIFSNGKKMLIGVKNY